MCSVFDIAKNVFKINQECILSSLSTDRYAKMTKAKKLLLSSINRICSENLINIYMHSHYRSLNTSWHKMHLFI